MTQNIHSMNNKHVYLRNTECVGNDVKEVNDILSQIYIKWCLFHHVVKQKGIKFKTFRQNDVQKGVIALIRKSLEI